jgi:Spy/CpxP family protein refolding chaperone
MKLAKWLAFTLVAALAVGGAMVARTRAAEAQQLNPALGADPGAHGQLGPGIVRQLGLSREQKRQIRAVLVGDKDKLTARLTAARDARVNLRSTIRTPGASENEIRGASAGVAAAEADLAVERAALYGKFSTILTAEQMARLNQLQQRADNLADGAIVRLGRRLSQ